MPKDKSVPPRLDSDRKDDPQHTKPAHEQADKDIANDPDFAPGSPNDDLDEGELARLGENNNPVE